ncbi:MAG: MFS transporter, partial [Microcella sp.]
GLVLVLPVSAVFGVTGAGFALSAIAVFAVGALGRVGAPAEPLRRRLGVGLAVLTRTPGPRLAAVLDGATAAVYATVLVLTVVIVQGDGVDATAPRLALALLAFGAGSVAVALLLAWLLRRMTDVAVMRSGATLAAVALAATGAVSALDSLSLAAVLVLWFVLGAASSAISTPSARLIRREVLPERHAATFAARFSTSHAWYALTYPAAGVIAAQLTPAFALIALAVVASAVVVAAIPMEVEGRRG